MPGQATRFYSRSLDRALPVERLTAIQRCLQLLGRKRGSTPFPAQAVWCILLLSRKVKRTFRSYSYRFIALYQRRLRLPEADAVCALANFPREREPCEH